MKKREKKNSEKLTPEQYVNLVKREKNFRDSMPKQQICYETWSNNFDLAFGKDKKKDNNER